MRIIADSGSTKTTWMEVATGRKVVTEGLNPHFTSDEAFLAACEVVSDRIAHNSAVVVRFYGAGCGSEVQRERVKGLLQKAFGTEDVTVETDMLGACRAVCGRERGLVGILGGYVLGDHGSANHVGRRLLQDYLSRVMPRNLMDMFQEAYPMTKEEFLEAVYHRPHANRFLASLARFAVEHIGDDYCSSEILVSLYEWYGYQLEGIRKLYYCDALYLVGGFAARIRPLLDIVANDKGREIKTVVADPIDGLRRYHE